VRGLVGARGRPPETTLDGTEVIMRVALLSLGLLAWASSGRAAEVPNTAEGIANYHVVRPGLATSGELSAQAQQQLKALGFKTVIDLRTEREDTKAEEAVVTAQGLRYVSVPVTPDTLSAKEVDAVAAVLEDAAAEPVLLHCASGNRAGGLLAAVLARKGQTLEEAEAEGVKAGLSSQTMKDAVRRVSAPVPQP
jgi:uncharacterized protein (TIGR01244 family)